MSEPRRSSPGDPEGTTSEQTPPEGEPQHEPGDPEGVLDVFGRPQRMTGIQTAYQFAPWLDVTAWVVNRWETETTHEGLDDNNRDKSFGGRLGVTPLAEMAPDEWRRVIDVNLTGVFNGCRAAAAHFIAQGRGKVINVASVLGAVGLPGYTAYGASKGGVMALTRTLAVEWARHNVQVNAIAPGWFVTDTNDEAFADPRIRDRLLRDVPARRTGRLDEIGPLAVYLASPASDFMTGQTIYLDGGHSAG